MRKIIALACVLGLAGCGTDLYDKPGGTEAQFQQDMARCQAFAMTVPLQRTPLRPVYNGSSMTTVNGMATTNYTGSWANTNIQGTAVTTPVPDSGAQFQNGMSQLGDAIGNALRQRQATRYCMASQGYTLRQ